MQGGGQLLLLTNPQVQEDLKMSGNQTSKIATLNAEVRSQWEAFRGFWRPGQEPSQERKEEYLARLRKQAKENREAVAAILDTPQKKRLKQIGWQVTWNSGFTDVLFDPEIIAKLELTADQIDQFHEIQDHARKEAWKPREPHKDQDWEARRKRMDEIRRAAQGHIMNGLTSDQKSRWQEMIGESFKGEIRMQPSPPHRGHRAAEIQGREKRDKPPPQE
jgi:hypothetical protein